jgi:RimJ/RimL family protein N-acetyltransferase
MTVVLQVDAGPSAPALLLRPWRGEDIERLVDAYRDPVLQRWTTHSVESTEDASRWLEAQKDGWKRRDRFSFAVLLDQPRAGDSRLAGHVVLKMVDPTAGSAQVGYWTAAHVRGRGVAPRALEAVTVWAFDTFAVDGLDRLELLHQVDNHASCRVAQKAQYQFEQVLPAGPTHPKDGHLHVRRAAAPA